MFTSNTHLQLQWSVMNPPAVGPTIEARPNTPPNNPCARARWAGAKRSPMTVKTVANSTPPKMPWMPRATISCVRSCESEQERLPTEQVAELSGDRRDGGRGHEVCGRHPCEAVEPVEVGHDPRDGGT